MKNETSSNAEEAETDVDESWQETSLLGDCVWFLTRLSKYLREYRRIEPSAVLLNSAMLLLNKYTLKKGLQASLLD